ncbi:MAG: hypothetical protein RJA70_20 [Pseudomonadota bacterium]|jgi:hypothetical protein
MGSLDCAARLKPMDSPGARTSLQPYRAGDASSTGRPQKLD